MHLPRARLGADRIARLVTALLVAWALFRGFGDPVLAVADRGDFYRVGTPAGIVVPEARGERAGAVLTYALRNPSFDATTSSGAVIAFVARALPGRPRAEPGTLDVRQVGFVYTVLVAAGVGAALALGLPPALGLLVTWASIGPARLALQNSLLTEPAALVALSALTALLAAPHAGARGVKAALALVAFTLLGGFARAPASLLPLTVVAALALTPWARLVCGRRGLVLLVLVGLAACLPVVHALSGDAARFRQINVYHAVFRGVALLSPSPVGVLTRLGVGARHVDRVGSSYFDAPVPDDLAASLERVSRVDIAVELVREPRALAFALPRITRSLAEEWTPGSREVPRESFEWWSISSLYSRVFGSFPPLVWVAAIGAGAFCLRRGGPVRAAALLLVLTLVTQLPITLLGDGLFALGRHLVLARAAAQLLVVLALWDAGRVLLLASAEREARVQVKG